MEQDYDPFQKQHEAPDYIYRQLPTTNPDMLIQSAKNSQGLLNDAQKVVDAITKSKPFSQRLISAAQQSKTANVNDMIRKTGVKTLPDISFNPDGIRFDFHSKGGQNQTICCRLIVSLKWANL